MGDKQILVSVAVEVCPKRAFGLSTCVHYAKVSLRKLAIAIAFIKANLTLKLGEGQIVVPVSVEIGHAHSMTEKSANMSAEQSWIASRRKAKRKELVEARLRPAGQGRPGAVMLNVPKSMQAW